MKSDIATKITTQIRQVKWPVGEKFIAFDTPSCAIDKPFVESTILEIYIKSKSWLYMLPCGKRLIEKDEYEAELQTQMVKVKMIDIGWVFANDKSFL